MTVKGATGNLLAAGHSMHNATHQGYRVTVQKVSGDARILVAKSRQPDIAIVNKNVGVPDLWEPAASHRA